MKKRITSLLLVFVMLLSMVPTAFAEDLGSLQTRTISGMIDDSTIWSYVDDGSVTDTNWNTADYNDSDWKAGKGPFGSTSSGSTKVNNVTAKTKLSGCDGENNIPACFFRSKFYIDASDLNNIEKLVGTIEYDDAVTVYINGTKVFEDIGSSEITTNLQYAGEENAYQRSGQIMVSDSSVWQAGVNTVAVKLYQSSATSGIAWFNMNLAPHDGVQEEIDEFTIWSYLDDNTDPAGEDHTDRLVWTYVNYNDEGWKSGFAPFGARNGYGGVYNNNPYDVLATKLDGVTKNKDNVPNTPAYFFRTELYVEDAGAVTSLKGSISYDDAVIVYINGTKVFEGKNQACDKSGTPLDKVIDENLQYGGVNQSAASQETLNLTDAAILNALKTGNNTVAVELHQSSESSGDLWFNFELAPSDEVIEYQTDINLTPGTDNSQMNFTWHYVSDDVGKVLVAKADTLEDKKTMPDAAAEVTATVTATTYGQYSNKATVTGLEAGTTYAYQLVNGDDTSAIKTFTTEDGGAFSFAYVADPQIGVSAVSVDTKLWANTLNQIDTSKNFSDASFLLMAGDLVDTASVNTETESEYGGLLNHDTLRSLPIVPIIGNHDNVALFKEHFVLPNESDKYGCTKAGGDYYFIYNNVLFLILNSNNRSASEHEIFMKAAIEATKDQDIQWKVVSMHHSLYSTVNKDGRDNQTDRQGIRNTLVPVFNNLDIDVVLLGHDHVYCRTYMMDGVDTFEADANYTYDNGEKEAPTAVTNPDGILYVSLNSGSGSKYNNLGTAANPYAAFQSDERVPNLANVSVSENEFTITTYRTTDMSVMDTFTINHTEKNPGETPEEPITATEINENTVWSYLDDGTDPAGDASAEGYERTSWTAVEYDDSAWKTSKGSLGAKRGEIGSVDGYTPDYLLNQYKADGSNVEAFFFRTKVMIEDASDVKQILGNVFYDDSATVYINSTKVAGFDDGEIIANLQYGGHNSSTAEGKIHITDAATLSALRDGVNVVAVEVHQGRAASSDIYFGMPSLEFLGEAYVEPVVLSNISLSMGADQTKMNFTWHVNTEADGKLLIAKASELVDGAMPQTATAYAATSELNNDGKYTNKAVASDLEAGVEYAYQVVNGEAASEIGFFTPDDGGAFSFAYVGDPQIGASGNVSSDTSGWDKTLNIIDTHSKFDDISFLLSAGDQVNTASDESQYDGYLDHAALKNLPVATIIGNHDSSSNAYAQHFNVANESDAYGTTNAGGDYWFVYNNVLFMVLNSNDQSAAEHKAFMQDAIAANPDVDWKIVSFHHSIYTVASHAEDGDILSRRNTLVPILEELGIDVVLMGHDHVYCRTYMMDGLEVSQNETYTYGNGENEAPTEVTNPNGILYVTANSGSGSKHYSIKSTDYPYSAVQNQERVPNVSKVTVSENQFTITTYRTTDMSVVDTFTINRTEKATEEPVKLVINQVYGDGGKDETPVANSFVEIYNPNNEDVSLAGYTLTCGNQVLTLDENKSIPANGSYLIVGAAANTSAEFQTYALPEADQNCDWTIDNKEYTIELKKGNTVLDSVTAGKGETTKVSKQKSLQRVDHADTDTDSDFRIVVWEKGAMTADESSLSQYAPHNSKGEYGSLLADKPEETVTINTTSDTGLVKYLSSYSTGNTNADGGVAEIVKFNEENDCMYLVSGQTQTLDIVKIKADGTTQLIKQVDIAALGAANGFSAGDITSVDVNTDRHLVAIAVQNADYATNGVIVTLDYEGNFVAKYEAGVQPDMVTFAPNGNSILSANEGEPRNGYGEGATDPMGSVTVVDLTTGNATTYTFESLDSSRDALINDGVLLKTDTAPSVDLEPEFISVSSDSNTAYVTLQENNAVAALDLTNGTWKYVKGLGFKDYSAEGNGLDLDVDGKIDIRNENVYGVYMPDGISVVTIGGQDYLITANEGDAREWGEDDNEYANIDSEKLVLSDGNEAGKKIEFLDTTKTDGLTTGNTYILGGRSFSIWKADTLEQVFDSGNNFETITADAFPEYFNSGHDEAGLDKRSHKKGVEPESVSVLETNGKIYAIIGLERMGGIMVYDISDPDNAVCADYLNVRGFSETVKDLSKLGDLGPEGICTISAENSPTGNAMILVANEVSGTVTVAQIEKVVIDNGDNDDDDYGGSSSGTTSKPSGGTTEKEEEKTSFVDVAEEAYYAPAVKWAVENGVTSGTSSTTFSPDQPCTRAQIVTFLWRAAGSPTPANSQMPFEDVHADAYYYKAVQWAVENGITSGASATTFAPDLVCTRAQIATFLWRSQNASKVENAEMVFVDVSASAYYYNAVLWAVENGITNGTSAITFSPDQACTRAQIVTFIYRCFIAK